jgi:hypothetical protein
MKKITLALLIIVLEFFCGCKSSNLSDDMQDKSKSPIADGIYKGRVVSRNLHHDNVDKENLSLSLKFSYKHNDNSTVTFTDNNGKTTEFSGKLDYEVLARTYPYYVEEDSNCFVSNQADGSYLIFNKCVYANKIIDLGNASGFISKFQLFNRDNKLKDEGVLYFSNANLGNFKSDPIKLDNGQYESTHINDKDSSSFNMTVVENQATIEFSDKNTSLAKITTIGIIDVTKMNKSIFAPNQGSCFSKNSINEDNDSISLDSCALVSNDDAAEGNKAIIGHDVFCARYNITSSNSDEIKLGLVCFHKKTT